MFAQCAVQLMGEEAVESKFISWFVMSDKLKCSQEAGGFGISRGSLGERQGSLLPAEELGFVPKQILGNLRGAPAGTASQVLLSEARGTSGTADPSAG